MTKFEPQPSLFIKLEALYKWKWPRILLRLHYNGYGEGQGLHWSINTGTIWYDCNATRSFHWELLLDNLLKDNEELLATDLTVAVLIDGVTKLLDVLFGDLARSTELAERIRDEILNLSVIQSSTLVRIVLVEDCVDSLAELVVGGFLCHVNNSKISNKICGTCISRGAEPEDWYLPMKPLG